MTTSKFSKKELGFLFAAVAGHALAPMVERRARDLLGLPPGEDSAAIEYAFAPAGLDSGAICRLMERLATAA